jgi:hypothetical protein
MNRVDFAATLLLLLTSCGTLRAPAPFSRNQLMESQLITWNDGDPLVPVCGSELVNCKVSFTVHNRTTDSVVIIPITQTSYMAPNTADTFEVRTNGYDWTGAPISSDYVLAVTSP